MSRFPRKRFNKKCVVCSVDFQVVKSRMTAKFCSNECKSKFNTQNDNYFDCGYCAKPIKELARHRDQIKRHGAKDFYCDRDCYHSSRAHAVGTVIQKVQPSGRIYNMVKVSRSSWRSEHRLVVEKFIGRNLGYYSEPILHINGDTQDNRIDNLFICQSLSHSNLIIKSDDYSFPTKSNVNEYVRLHKL